MQDGRKAVWSIPYISVAFLPSLKQNFIAYRSSKVSSCPDCIFEIHQLWQSVFSRIYPIPAVAEIIKIGQSSHKNFQESTTILNACTKKAGNLYIYIYIFWRGMLQREGESEGEINTLTPLYLNQQALRKTVKVYSLGVNRYFPILTVF